MANNRMYLVCEVCTLKPELAFEDCVVFVAKYYPTSWFMPSHIDAIKALGEFFAKHDHKEGGNSGQYISLHYEGVFSETGKAKLEILDSISKVMRKKDDSPPDAH